MRAKMKKVIFVLIVVLTLGLACGDSGNDNRDDYREVDSTPICIGLCD